MITGVGFPSTAELSFFFVFFFQNSVRHNLSLNKCFEKIDNPKASGNARKGCLWGLNPAKIEKMDEEISKWRKKDPQAIRRSMAKPGMKNVKVYRSDPWSMLLGMNYMISGY